MINEWPEASNQFCPWRQIFVEPHNMQIIASYCSRKDRTFRLR